MRLTMIAIGSTQGNIKGITIPARKLPPFPEKPPPQTPTRCVRRIPRARQAPHAMLVRTKEPELGTHRIQWGRESIPCIPGIQKHVGFGPSAAPGVFECHALERSVHVLAWREGLEHMPQQNELEWALRAIHNLDAKPPLGHVEHKNCNSTQPQDLFDKNQTLSRTPPTCSLGKSLLLGPSPLSTILRLDDGPNKTPRCQRHQ